MAPQDPPHAIFSGELDSKPRVLGDLTHPGLPRLRRWMTAELNGTSLVGSFAQPHCAFAALEHAQGWQAAGSQFSPIEGHWPAAVRTGWRNWNELAARPRQGHCQHGTPRFVLSNDRLKFKRMFETRLRCNQGIFVISQGARVLGKFLQQKKDGKPLTITSDGTQTRDFTHVADVVRANLLAAESPHVGNGDVINIGCGRNVSINDLATMIGGPSVHVEARLEPHDTQADTRRAKELLGWEPTVSLEQGIAELKKLMDLD